MQAKQIDFITRSLKCEYKTFEPLAPYTTFKIGGPAVILAKPANTKELIALYKLIHSENVPFFYLGLGSNILVSDEGFDGIVIKSEGDLCSMGKQGDFLFSGPGAKLIDLTCLAAEHSYSGMEPISGIPGSVGGGLWMNAGAYGGEIQDTLYDVDVLSENFEVVTLKKEEIGFGYRSAPALQKVIVLQSRYKLQTGDKANICAEMRNFWKLRREKQPLDFPSAGSMFKRPPGDYAGRLIEAVEGKGARIGDAMVSPKHAGIFINAGSASAKNVADLVKEIRRRVYEKFNIYLETEVKPIGFHEDPFTVPR